MLARTVLTTLALAVGPLPAQSTGEPVARPPDVSLDPTVELVDADAAQTAHAVDVLDRFARAGLALPALEIRFATDPTACRGHDGLFQQGHTPWRLLVCSNAAYLLPHELAHAWEAANLTDDDRQRYTEYVGLPTWDGRDVPREKRAEEHAAYVVQQNVMVTSGRADSPRWVERIEAYELLTGLPSPKRSE